MQGACLFGGGERGRWVRGEMGGLGLSPQAPNKVEGHMGRAQTCAFNGPPFLPPPLPPPPSKQQQRCLHHHPFQVVASFGTLRINMDSPGSPPASAAVRDALLGLALLPEVDAEGAGDPVAYAPLQVGAWGRGLRVSGLGCASLRGGRGGRG